MTAGRIQNLAGAEGQPCASTRLRQDGWMRREENHIIFKKIVKRPDSDIRRSKKLKRQSS
jgi:hypothetical protein